MNAYLVQEFVRAARKARDMAALSNAAIAATRALGFHHVMVQGAGGAVWLADAPLAWHTAGSGDAPLAAASQCYVPFMWCDLPRLISLTGAQATHLEQLDHLGFGAAMTVPVHRPCGSARDRTKFAGCCSFVMNRGAALPFASLAAAHFVGVEAFGAAEALRQDIPAPICAPGGPQLTPRQRDCVALAARGKSDGEIAVLLGIRESTVHKHIEDAKRRFGVCTRVQLVVRALADARLTFADVIG